MSVSSYMYVSYYYAYIDHELQFKFCCAFYKPSAVSESTAWR
jgi:hypothetical protein